MIRIIFAFIVVVHGLIHLMGFANEWQLAEIEQLTGKTLIPLSGGSAKVAGLLWLLATGIFIVAAAGYLMGKEWWWMLAFAGVLLSQLLIILYWQDAKAGTLSNIIILAVALFSYAPWSFDRQVDKELEAFLPDSISQQRETVTPSMMVGLPSIVQQWLIRTGVAGRPVIQTAYLRQRGQLRTKPDGKWMPVTAVQYTRVDNPGFLWRARIEAGSFMHISGRDKYEDGRGHMLIKLMSLIPVADAKGEKIDQGSMLRYLGEVVWAPTAALSRYLSWEEIDERTAKVTMTYKGISASGIFRFDAEGDFVSFEAERYYDRDDDYTLETWVVSASDYATFDGIRVPVDWEVTWKLKEGDYTWYKFQITELEYDVFL
jgi:hypothetical protein